MPSSFQIKAPIPNILDMFTPAAFETFCSEILAAENSMDHVHPSRSNHDGGVDILIKPVDHEYHFFGCRMSKKTDVRVEVKRRKTVDIDDFAKNLTKAGNDKKCGCFVLMTSAKININTYIDSIKSCDTNDLSFAYIHRDIILKTLIAYPKLAHKWGFDNKILDWQSISRQKYIPDIVCHWNFMKVGNNKGLDEKRQLGAPNKRTDIEFLPSDHLEVNLIIENWSKEKSEVSIVFDLGGWYCENPGLQNEEVLGGDVCSRSWIFRLNARRPTRLPKIYIRPKEAPSETLVMISTNELYALPAIEPQFVDRPAHGGCDILKKYIGQMGDSIVKAKPEATDEFQSEWFLIEGPTGVGKTRIIKEALGEEALGEHAKYHKIINLKGEADYVTILNVLSFIRSHCPVNFRGKNIDEVIELIQKNNGIKTKGPVCAMVKEASKIFTYRIANPLIIILENIHHGGQLFFDWLKLIFDNTTKPLGNGNMYRFCITSRNDDTFTNPRQADFIRTVQQHLQKLGLADERVLKIMPFDDEGAKAMVRSFFSGITDDACDLIVSTAENNPFNIIQVIEYLCEESLAEIIERQTYSIVNEDQFYTKGGFPSSMTAIFEERLKNLCQYHNGKKLLQLLYCLSLHGLQCDEPVFDRLRRAIMPRSDASRLFNAKYLSKNEQGQVRFIPNVQRFLLAQPMKNRNWQEAAKVLLGLPDILQGLEEWRRCQIHNLAGEEKVAMAIVAKAVGNRSVASLALDRRLVDIYQILKVGIDLWENRCKGAGSAKFLLQLYFLWAYASKFTQNYTITIRDALKALQDIRAHKTLKGLVGGQALALACAKIEQIVGHAYQNTGRIECSMRHILNAWATALSNPNEDASVLDLLFDAEDRMRKNFIVLGIPSAAKLAFDSALSRAKKKCDNILEGTAMHGEAELYFVQNPQQAERLWLKLEKNSKGYTDERTRITLHLALLQSRLLRAESDEEINKCLKQLNRIGAESEASQLIGPLSKINLLNGFAYYKLKEYALAKGEFLASYAKAEKTGYGTILWFAQNNIALMHLFFDKDDMKGPQSAYNSALDKAERQGFLRHLMAPAPMFFQTALIDNIFRFYARFHLEECREKLEERLKHHGCDPKAMPREGLAHKYFQTEHGIAMLFV